MPAQLTPTVSETLLYQPVMPRADALRVGWAYPADYNVAMSSLGYLSLFRQLDETETVHAERVYTDTVSRYRGSDFDVLGVSFSFELDILNILKLLEALQMPFYSRERTKDHPLVFAGGPVVMSNPEPYADFFDFFIVGEGEEVLFEVVSVIQNVGTGDRKALLFALASRVSGVYVPGFYDVSYGPDGAITSFLPNTTEIPKAIEKRIMTNLDTVTASSPILTENTIFSKTFLVEVMRGCAHRCRFCLASYTMLPVRGPALEPILREIETGLQYTNKIGLLGALIADHPDFPQLCEYLDKKMDQSPDMVVSSASLRGDTLTPQIARTFKKGKQRQLTIAVESGSEKLRRRINKNLKHEEILSAAAAVVEAGMPGLKLYGMVGLPDETEEDVVNTVDLVREIHKAYPRLDVVLGCSSFVPKGGTPFQWMSRLENKQVDRRFEILRKGLLKTAEFRPSSAKWDWVQAVLSRGDRRLAPILVRYYHLGGTLGSFNRAYKEFREESIPSADWFALRERTRDEILPWEHLCLGVSKDILYREGLPPNVLNH